MPKAPKGKLGKAVIHPNSRHASQMARQSHHDVRKQKSKLDTTAKQEQLRQRLQWFQDHMDPEKSSFTKHDLAVMITDYLNRFKDELEQISIINSVGNRQTKQHVARETAIRWTEERENYEFEGVGIEVPDLINGKCLNYFRSWTGEIRYFPNIKLRKIRKSDLNVETNQDEDKDSDKELPDYDDVAVHSEELPDYTEEKKESGTETASDLPDYVDKN